MDMMPMLADFASKCINYVTNTSLNIPGPFFCQKSGKLLTDPAITDSCKHVFDRAVLEHHVAQHQRCPNPGCRKKIEQITPNDTLRDKIRKHIRNKRVKMAVQKIAVGIALGAGTVIAGGALLGFEGFRIG
jgi:hypothetical protein